MGENLLHVPLPRTEALLDKYGLRFDKGETVLCVKDADTPEKVNGHLNFLYREVVMSVHTSKVYDEVWVTYNQWKIDSLRQLSKKYTKKGPLTFPESDWGKVLDEFLVTLTTELGYGRIRVSVGRNTKDEVIALGYTKDRTYKHQHFDYEKKINSNSNAAQSTTVI